MLGSFVKTIPLLAVRVKIRTLRFLVGREVDNGLGRGDWLR